MIYVNYIIYKFISALCNKMYLSEMAILKLRDMTKFLLINNMKSIQIFAKSLCIKIF